MCFFLLFTVQNDAGAGFDTKAGVTITVFIADVLSSSVLAENPVKRRACEHDL